MRLLYVEDNERLAQNTSASLKSNGFTLDCVHTGKDALHAAQSFDYDAIILDLGLPDIEGISVLKSVKDAKPDVPLSSAPRATR